MSAAPLPIALAEVLARGDVWCGDTLASLPEALRPVPPPEKAKPDKRPRRRKT